VPWGSVDMGGVWNTVNGGRRPLKFELFAGMRELTDPAVVGRFVVSKASCSTAIISDDAIDREGREHTGR
jgi:hypothetical protein